MTPYLNIPSFYLVSSKITKSLYSKYSFVLRILNFSLNIIKVCHVLNKKYVIYDSCYWLILRQIHSLELMFRKERMSLHWRRHSYAVRLLPLIESSLRLMITSVNAKTNIHRPIEIVSVLNQCLRTNFK
jgi:hypothetical protein